MPWVDHLQNCYQVYSKTQDYLDIDRAVTTTFASTAGNDKANLYTRVGVLEGLYKAGVRKNQDKVGIVRNIFQYHDQLDQLIQNGDAEAIRIIAAPQQGEGRGHYVFATKFCHFCNPTQYAIFDHFVECALTKFKSLADENLQALLGFPADQIDLHFFYYYERYREMIVAVRNALGWEDDENGFYKTDKALWLYMQQGLQGCLISPEDRNFLSAEARKLLLPRFIRRNNNGTAEWGEF